MARNNGFGKALLIGAAAAIAGGVAAYLRRKEIEGVVQDIADALDAREEDGFFSVDLGDEPVFHKVPMEGEETPDEAQESDFADSEEAPAEEAPDEPQESDFADSEAAPAEETPAEEAPAEEAPAAE